MTTREELIKIYGIQDTEITEWANLSNDNKNDVARILL